MTRKKWRLLVLLGTGALLIALGIVFLVLGLQDADMLGSTIGALTGVAGFGLAVWSSVAERRAARPRSATKPPKQPRNRHPIVAQIGNGPTAQGNGNTVIGTATINVDQKPK